MKKRARYEKRILITDGDARQSLTMARAFRRLGCHVTVLCYSRLDVCYASFYPNKRLLMPCGHREFDKQLAFLLELVQKGSYDLLLPIDDFTARLVSENKELFAKYVKRVEVNDWSAFSKIIDKRETMRICEENGIPAPKTVLTADPVAAIAERGLSYPVVIKPRTECGSIGFSVIESEEKLCSVIAEKGDCFGEMLVQEYIAQEEGAFQYGAEIFRDDMGIFRSVVVAEKHRWFPLDGGSTVACRGIRHPEIESMCKRLLDLLGWRGYANFDLMVDKEGKARILEINGRISAIVLLNFRLGINIAKLILDNAFGGDLSECYGVKNEKKRVCCALVDLLWFLKSPTRFRAKPSWFNRFGLKDVIFAWSDPLPSLAFFLQSLTKYKKAMKDRERE